MYKVYVLSDKWNDLDLITKDMTSEFDVKALVNLTEDEIIQECSDADALIIGYEEITNKIMDELKNLKVIQFMAIGVDGIDLEYARKKNIEISNVPGYCFNEVADHALALMLSLNRRVCQFNSSVGENIWDISLYPDITRLGESTIGLLGFGDIARTLNTRLQSFGSKVIAYDPFIDRKVGEELNVELVSLEELARESDYISCHLPLNDGTKELINKDIFKIMKDTAIFINTSRGGVVKEEDLVEALDNNEIAYAGLDVLVDEYPNLEKHPLNRREDVILTPHVAYYSKDSERDLLAFAGESVKNILLGDKDKASIVN